MSQSHCAQQRCLCRLRRPERFETLSGCPLTLRCAASAAGVPPHRNSLLLLQNIVKEGDGALQLPSVDGLSSLARVLERGAEVAAASPSGLCVVDAGCCVADLDAISCCLYSRTHFEENSAAKRSRRATYHRGVRRTVPVRLVEVVQIARLVQNAAALWATLARCVCTA